MVNLDTSPHVLAAIRQMLIDRFDMDEMRDLCFSLGIDYAILPQLRTGMARELVVLLVRHNRMSEFIRRVEESRPDINVSTYVQTYLNSAHKKEVENSTSINLNVPEVLWSKHLGHRLCATPLISKNICLLPLRMQDNKISTLRAMSLQEGDVLWELEFDNAIINGLVKAADDCVLISLSQSGEFSGEAQLIAIDMRGREKWSYFPEAQTISPAVVADISSLNWDSLSPSNPYSNTQKADDVIISSFHNSTMLAAITADKQWLEIVNLETGQHLMEINLPSEASNCAPAFCIDTFYIPCLAPTLLAIALTGEIIWRFDVTTLSGIHCDQTPCVVGNLVITPMCNGFVYAIRTKDGTIAWEAHISRSKTTVSPPISDGTKVYLGLDDGVHALHLTNGHETWFYPQSCKSHKAPPLLWNHLVLSIMDQRKLLAINRHDGNLCWEATLDVSGDYLPGVDDGDEDGPYTLVIDTNGHSQLLSLPTTPPLHEAAGRWRRAAQSWESIGRLRRAAFAWIRHAKVLIDKGQPLSACAPAWEAAERLFTLLGDEKHAASCRLEYARCLRLPLISLDVEYKGLVVNTWSLLNFSVRNEGYGVARQLVIQIHATQFEGQVAMTQVLTHLPAGRSRIRRLDIKPLVVGSAVPLHVEVSYQDEDDQFHSQEEVIHLVVSEVDTQPSPSLLPVLAHPSHSEFERMTLRAAVDVEVRFISRSQDAYGVEITLDDGHVFSGGKLSKDIITWRSKGNLVEDGRYLFSQLLSDPSIKDAWRVAQGEAIKEKLARRLRVRIGHDVAELNVIPWELLHDGNMFLSANSNTPFSRYLPVAKPWGHPLISKPIRVLGVISNPRDTYNRYKISRLDVDLEKYILATAFKDLDQSGVRLEFLPAPVTMDNLSKMLRHGYHIVHFVAHGRFVRHRNSSEIYMEDADGECMPISDEMLAQLFANIDIQPHLVYLSVCQSASHSSREAFVGMGPKLVQSGIPAVIGMRDRVQISTARKITQIFYRRLTAHGIVDQALNETRASLLVSDPEAIQTPILFMRLQTGQLWDTLIQK